MRAEDIKSWLKLSKPPERDTDPAAQPGPWNTLCELAQHLFRTQEIPQELAWQYLALLPKADGGTRGVGLLEVVWKLVEAIIDNRLKASVKMFPPAKSVGHATSFARLMHFNILSASLLRCGRQRRLQDGLRIHQVHQPEGRWSGRARGLLQARLQIRHGCIQTSG